ncbi:hypothetical protein CEXT_681291 [Caerostris extrusa]|uniref:Uncharacterized protein n=1 Tax=Caerostris extrusa TaxID=172846 RepID=A0AAV4RCA9_CAEEX|nr:hypothetical protein CEXT_681291 [Caerostris extrusa]
MGMKSFTDEKTALAWAGCRKGNSTFFIASEATEENGTPAPSEPKPAGASAERHSFPAIRHAAFLEMIPSGKFTSN